MHWSLYHYHYPAWIPSTLLLFNKMKVRFLTAYPLVTWLLASPLTVHRPTEMTTAPEIQWQEDRGSLTRITGSHPPMPYTPELRFLLPSCCKCLHQDAFTWLPLGCDWRWGTGWEGTQRSSLWCWKLLISWWGGISTDGGVCQNSLNYVTMHAFYLTGL